MDRGRAAPAGKEGGSGEGDAGGAEGGSGEGNRGKWRWGAPEEEAGVGWSKGIVVVGASGGVSRIRN